jgi:hypothetical protein
MARAKLQANPALTEALKPGAWSWDITRDCLVGDARLAKLFGMNEAAVSAGVPLRAMLDKIHPEDRGAIESSIQRSVGLADEYFASYRVLAGPDVRWLHASGRCFAPDGKRPSLHVGVAIDVTGFKALGAKDGLHDLSEKLDRIAQLCLSAHEIATDVGDPSLISLTKPLLHRIGALIGARLLEDASSAQK